MVWKGAIAVRRYFLLLILSAALLLTACGKTSPATWQEQYDLGVKYLSEGNYEEAVIAFTAAIEIDPRRPEAYEKAAEAYVALGRVDEARELLEEALERIEDETLRQLYLRLGRTDDPFYDQLTEEQKDLLAELTAAVLARDWRTALAIQSGETCRALVNALPVDEEGDRLSLCFYPDDTTRVSLFRGTGEGEADSHMDIFRGADGEGGLIASVYSPDHYYMNAVPFAGGAVSGELTSYNRRWRDGTAVDYTVTGTIQNGALAGQVVYTYSDGSTHADEGEGFTSWPDWPAELAK